MPAKTHFFEIILKVHWTKRENAFENLNYISFATWAVTENPNIRVYMWPVGRLNSYIYVVHFFSQIGLMIWVMCFEIEVSLKNGKINQNCHSESIKNQRCSVLFQRKSALFSSKPLLVQRKSALILSSENFCFQRCAELNQRCSEILGNEQCWNRPGILLNQSWSALKFFKTSTWETLDP